MSAFDRSRTSAASRLVTAQRSVSRHACRASLMVVTSEPPDGGGHGAADGTVARGTMDPEVWVVDFLLLKVLPLLLFLYC